MSKNRFVKIGLYCQKSLFKMWNVSKEIRGKSEDTKMVVVEAEKLNACSSSGWNCSILQDDDLASFHEPKCIF